MTDDEVMESDTPKNSDEDIADNTSEIEAVPPEILEELPEEQREKVLRAFYQLIKIEREEFFQGPLPPPSTLKGYEDVLPGSANRIITMAEKQQEHRIGMERVVIRSDIVMERLGLVAGFILAMVLAVGGIWLASDGKELTGLVVLVGEIGVLAGTFLYAQSRRQRELDERKKTLEEEPTE